MDCKYTVEPLYNNHLWDWGQLAFNLRWPLKWNRSQELSLGLWQGAGGLLIIQLPWKPHWCPLGTHLSSPGGRPAAVYPPPTQGHSEAWKSVQTGSPVWSIVHPPPMVTVCGPGALIQVQPRLFLNYCHDQTVDPCGGVTTRLRTGKLALYQIPRVVL